MPVWFCSQGSLAIQKHTHCYCRCWGFKQNYTINSRSFQYCIDFLCVLLYVCVPVSETERLTHCLTFSLCFIHLCFSLAATVDFVMENPNRTALLYAFLLVSFPTLSPSVFLLFTCQNIRVYFASLFSCQCFWLMKWKGHRGGRQRKREMLMKADGKQLEIRGKYKDKRKSAYIISQSLSHCPSKPCKPSKVLNHTVCQLSAKPAGTTGCKQN